MSAAARAALLPLSAAFGLGAAVRVQAYLRGWARRERLRGPVISVGNLAVGGRGKTPVVALVAETVRDAGLPVAVLSRGYGGSHAGTALLVSDGARVLAEAAVAGDEPVMLARQLPGVRVAVGRRRADAGRLVEERFGPCVHVLDDGFQHLALARDLDVLCLAPEDLRDWPLPGGRLREFRGARRRADLVLVERTAATEAWVRTPEAAPVHLLSRVVSGFTDLAGRARSAPSRAFVVAGIARPERVVDDVRRCTAVVGTALFPDHHVYTAEDVARVAAEASRAGADALVTTAKDAVRLPPLGEVPVVVLRVRAEVDDLGAFRERVLAVARRCA